MKELENVMSKLEKATKKKMNYDNFYKKSLYTDNYSNNAKRDLDLEKIIQ